MKGLGRGLLLSMFACFSAAAADNPPVYQIAIPGIAADARLIGIKLTIRFGRVYRLVECPAGWSVNVLNDPNWTTTLDAQAIVGAAAVTPREASTMILVAAMPGVDASSATQAISATGELTTMRYGNGDTGTVKMYQVKLVRLRHASAER